MARKALQDEVQVPIFALSVENAARAAGSSRTMLFQAIRDGNLRAKKIGRRTIVEAEELRRFISALPSR